MQEGNQKLIHFLGGSVCTSGVLDKEVKLLCSGLSFCCIPVSFKISFLRVNKYISLNFISSKLTELKEVTSLEVWTCSWSQNWKQSPWVLSLWDLMVFLGRGCPAEVPWRAVCLPKERNPYTIKDHTDNLCCTLDYLSLEFFSTQYMKSQKPYVTSFV